ncbi:MAG: MFS transporter [Gemmatimonadaceae bacterium]
MDIALRVLGFLAVVGVMGYVLRPVPSSLRVLMFTAFMDMVGLLMVMPLLPFYAKDLGASGFTMTLIVSSFSAAQLLSAPLWGRVSDKYGRRPALIIGLAASAVSYVVFAFADSLWLLLVSRIIQGAGGGTVGVIQAYVSDAMEPRKRAQGLGWLSAATNVGVMIGPVLGSETSRFGRPAPGLIAAALCILNIVFVWYYLIESHGVEARKKAKTARPTREAVYRILFHPADPATRLIWIYAISIGAFYGVTASGILTFFLDVRYNVTPQTIGYFFAYIGVLNVVFRVGLLGKVIDKFGEGKTARLGIVLLALGLFAIPLTNSIPLLAIAAGLLPLGATFTFPAVTALLSQVIGEHERGLYMGLQQTFGGIVRVIYPLWAGFAWDKFAPAVPFWTSAGLVAAMFFLAIGLEAYQHQKTGEHPVVVEV